MKTLKAITHYLQGYKLHPKESRRLEDLWINTKVLLMTLGIATILLWMLI